MEGNPDYPYPELIGMYHGGEPSINAEFDKSGETVKISVTTENIPDTAKIYFASYDASGKLKELKTNTLSNKDTSGQMSLKEVLRIKVFAWNENLYPYTDICEWYVK